MKISPAPAFQPVTITIETHDEAVALARIINAGLAAENLLNPTVLEIRDMHEMLMGKL